MNRLSWLDASFIYMETPETPMHVGSLTIFAPPANPGDLFARFRDRTAARLDLLPSYRRRLKMTPLAIDHPVWVDDDDLDLDYHIQHAALPKPGTLEQLRTLVARLHAIALDPARPLWQYYLIEGLEDGGFAVYIKLRHAGMDGVAGMATLDVLFDFSPLIAAVPASFRAPGDSRLNVQTMFTLCRLATDVPEPLARLAAMRVAAEEAKELFADVKQLLTTEVSVPGAPLAMTALYRMMQSRARRGATW